MRSAFIDSLLDLLFPEACAACGRYGVLLCRACRRGVQAYPAGDRIPEALDGAAVACIYDATLQAAVHAFKYHKRRRLAGPLGDMLAEHLRAHPLPADVLIPVPLHAERLAERGFNQAEDLARRLAHHCKLPVLSKDLARRRDTGHQARLGRRARQENMSEAFVWLGKRPPPARILLIDDVLTTGATLAACAMALRAAGAREVRAAAVARSLLE